MLKKTLCAVIVILCLTEAINAGGIFEPDSIYISAFPAGLIISDTFEAYSSVFDNNVGDYKLTNSIGLGMGTEYRIGNNPELLLMWDLSELRLDGLFLLSWVYRTHAQSSLSIKWSPSFMPFSLIAGTGIGIYLDGLGNSSWYLRGGIYTKRVAGEGAAFAIGLIADYNFPIHGDDNKFEVLANPHYYERLRIGISWLIYPHSYNDF